MAKSKRRVASAQPSTDVTQAAFFEAQEFVQVSYCEIGNHKWVSSAATNIIYCSVCKVHWEQVAETFLASLPEQSS